MRSLRKPFRLKWMVLLAAVTFFACILALWQNVYFAEERLASSRRQTAEVISNLLRGMVTEDFRSRDEQRIAGKILHVSLAARLPWIQARDAQGSPIAQHGVKVGANFRDEDSSFLVKIVGLDGTSLGGIEFGLPVAVGREKANRQLVLAGFCIIIVTFLLLAFLYWAHFMMLQPYEEVLQHLSSVGKGDLRPFKKYLDKKDERREMACACNKIVDDFTNYQAEVANAAQDKAVARVTAMLAHDVRKPFTMMRALLGLLADAESIEQVHEITKANIDEVERSIGAVSGLVQDVMFASGRINIEPEPIRPETLVHNTITDLFRMQDESNIALEYDFAHTTLVKVDSRKVQRVFANIAGNAVQAMHGKGKIWFRTRTIERAERRFVEFVIGNDGPRIPSADLARLFEAFFTTGKKGGTGLGLAIAERIVKIHGGKIWCESSESSGTEFHFVLPAAEGNVLPLKESLPNSSKEIASAYQLLRSQPKRVTEFASALATESRLKPLLAAFHERKIAVLILDDEGLYRDSIVDKIRRTNLLNERITLQLASNSDEALDAIACEEPVLGIFDIDLGPKSPLNGIELVKKLRKKGADFFICVHTNRIVEGDTKLTFDAGADSYLPKPMGRAQFLKILCIGLEKWLRKHPETLQSTKTAVVANAATVPSIGKEDAPCVAVLDDSLIFQIAWKQSLKSCSVYTFETPEAFLGKVESDSEFAAKLDLVIADQNYGDKSEMTGTEFAKKFMDTFACPVFISSNSESSDFEAFDPRLRLIGKSARSWDELEPLLKEMSHKKAP